MEALEEELEGDAGEDDGDDDDDESGGEEEAVHVGARVADGEREGHGAAQAGEHEHQLVREPDLVRAAQVQQRRQREDVRRAPHQNGHLHAPAQYSYKYAHTHAQN